MTIGLWDEGSSLSETHYVVSEESGGQEKSTSLREGDSEFMRGGFTVTKLKVPQPIRSPSSQAKPAMLSPSREARAALGGQVSPRVHEGNRVVLEKVTFGNGGKIRGGNPPPPFSTPLDFRKVGLDPKGNSHPGMFAVFEGLGKIYGAVPYALKPSFGSREEHVHGTWLPGKKDGVWDNEGKLVRRSSSETELIARQKMAYKEEQESKMRMQRAMALEKGGGSLLFDVASPGQRQGQGLSSPEKSHGGKAGKTYERVTIQKEEYGEGALLDYDARQHAGKDMLATKYRTRGPLHVPMGSQLVFGDVVPNRRAGTWIPLSTREKVPPNTQANKTGFVTRMSCGSSAGQMSDAFDMENDENWGGVMEERLNELPPEEGQALGRINVEHASARGRRSQFRGLSHDLWEKRTDLGEGGAGAILGRVGVHLVAASEGAVFTGVSHFPLVLRVLYQQPVTDLDHGAIACKTFLPFSFNSGSHFSSVHCKASSREEEESFERLGPGGKHTMGSSFCDWKPITWCDCLMDQHSWTHTSCVGPAAATGPTQPLVQHNWSGSSDCPSSASD